MAVPCPCQDAMRAERSLTRAGIPARYAREGFATYQPAHRSQEMALVKTRGFADRWPEMRGEGFALIGPCGVGKTHLATALLRGCHERGASIYFTDTRQLLTAIQETFKQGNNGPTEHDILRPVLRSDIVVLDEIGGQRITDWSFDVMARILGTRYNDALSTVVTSNFPFRDGEGQEARWARGGAAEVETLGKILGTPILSRLSQMCELVEIDGADRRRRR